MGDLERHVEALEGRVDREFRHAAMVMATQRGIIRRSFEQVNLAFLEQQLAFTRLGERVASALGEVAQAQREQAGEIAEIKRRLDRLENPPAA